MPATLILQWYTRVQNVHSQHYSNVVEYHLGLTLLLKTADVTTDSVLKITLAYHTYYTAKIYDYCPTSLSKPFNH